MDIIDPELKKVSENLYGEKDNKYHDKNKKNENEYEYEMSSKYIKFYFSLLPSERKLIDWKEESDEQKRIKVYRVFYVLISNMVAAIWAISHNSASYLYLAIGYIFIFFIILILCFAATTIAAPYEKVFGKVTFKSFVFIFLFFFITAALIILSIKN